LRRRAAAVDAEPATLAHRGAFEYSQRGVVDRDRASARPLGLGSNLTVAGEEIVPAAGVIAGGPMTVRTCRHRGSLPDGSEEAKPVR
jgi:hypothetical protein